jgi:hypothetical protein
LWLSYLPQSARSSVCEAALGRGQVSTGSVVARQANPNPSRVSNAIWGLWLDFKAVEPTVRFGGSYAPKTGYHDTRLGNPRGDYSVQLRKDRMGPADKAAAIDLTFPSAQRGDYRIIRKYSMRLLRSGRDARDERGNYLREFYGNAVNNMNVDGWDYQYVCLITSDPSHLWHIHLSILRAHLNDPVAMRAILSILRGESVGTWRQREAVIKKTGGVSNVPAARPPAVERIGGGEDMALSDKVYKRKSDGKVRTTGNILSSVDVLTLRQEGTLTRIEQLLREILAELKGK